jgi:hypothetical protein
MNIATTESRGIVINTSASFSGDAGFKSRHEDRLSWLNVRSFPQSLQENPGIVP